jgi:hypothetical protein
MSGEVVYLTTPVGRYVMGDAFTGNDKDMQGRPKFDKAGKPKTTWFVGLAIRKDDPAWAELWAQIVAVGQRDFPAGQWQSPAFAWKVIDGDGVNQNGQSYPEHCKGCYVVRMSSGFAPSVHDNSTPPRAITDPAQCKRGDYIRAYIGIRGNDDQQKPGVYVSHSMIQVVGYGEAISSGPSAEQAFGAPAALPPGASTTPIASAPMPAPAGAPAPAPMQQPAAPVPGAPAPMPAQAPAVSPGGPTASPGNAVPVGQGVPAPYPQILQGPTG